MVGFLAQMPPGWLNNCFISSLGQSGHSLSLLHHSADPQSLLPELPLSLEQPCPLFFLEIQMSDVSGMVNVLSCMASDLIPEERRLDYSLPCHLHPTSCDRLKLFRSNAIECYVSVRCLIKHLKAFKIVLPRILSCALSLRGLIII